MNIAKKGNIMGQFGRQMSIFTYFQYSLIHDLTLNQNQSFPQYEIS